MTKKKITNKDKAIQARKLLEAQPDFRWKIIETQMKWKISKFDKDEGEDVEKNIDMMPRLKVPSSNGIKVFSSPEEGTEFYKDMMEILEIFHLRKQYWLEPLSHYVLYNNFGEQYSEAEARPGLEHDVDPVSKQAVTKIVLGKNTTIEDVKRIWPDISRFQDVLYDYRPPKFKYRENLDRDLDILALSSKKGIMISDIGNYIRDKYRDDLDYSNIRKIISSMRKEFGVKRHKIKTAKFNVGRLK